MTLLELKKALTKSQKCESPGTEKVPSFWSNALSSPRITFTSLLNEIMQNLEVTDWVCEVTTYLLTKSNNRKYPKNYRLITSLLTTYKILISVLVNRKYAHLEQNDLLPRKQKGCRRASYGCKDQLMMNKMILENCKKRKTIFELCMDWKVFDSIPHEWFLISLELFKVSPRVVGFLKHNMEKIINSYT